MSTPSKKRPRREVEENKADCPFNVILEPEAGKKSIKRRKHGEPAAQKRVFRQLSPFAPVGKFKTHETLDLDYTVEPMAEWQEMTRYNSFVLNGSKYFSEGFIFVANDASIDRQDVKPNSRRRPTDDWVARILEIRASDEHHVYARVFWMYWPDELPPGTHDGKRYIQGRQPYHGTHELVASNHMDIINVVSVTAMAQVNHWVEENDDEIQNALYWRQAFDFRNLEVSGVEPACKCGQPENPDKTLVGCSSESCGKWLHDDCLIHDALLRTYERLGTTKPHVPTGATKQEEDTTKNPPLSPTETGVEETQQTIDVKADDGDVKAGETIAAKDSREESAESGGAGAAETPSKAAAPATEKKKRGRPSTALAQREKAAKPYLGLFSASLKMDVSPPQVEIVDLREGIKGGAKSWSEPLKCLVCGTSID